MKVSASILSCDFSNLKSEIRKLEGSGVDFIHLDIMDGHFVPNISFGSHLVKSIRKVSDIPFETHLMISNPKNFIEQFDSSETIIFHIESNDSTSETINKIKKMGKKIGISLKPKTNVNCILGYLHMIDLVLVMTVEPGFGGQKFMDDQVDKIKVLRQEIDEKKLSVEIEVDGGINGYTCKICKKNGADIAVAGTFIFNSKNIVESINVLKSL